LRGDYSHLKKTGPGVGTHPFFVAHARLTRAIRASTSAECVERSVPARDQQKDVVVTPDGWACADLDDFRLLVDYSPPRPQVYLRQFIADATNWRPVVLWIVGFGFLTLGIFLKQWQCAVVGVMWLSVLVRLFWRAVGMVRDSTLLVGIITALEQ
jgi:hypothetical protein